MFCAQMSMPSCGICRCAENLYFSGEGGGSSHDTNALDHFILKLLDKCLGQFKYINQLDATISQVYYLTFMYSSTCFGRPYAHHQEFNDCSSSLWFYRCSVVVAVLLFVVGQLLSS
jgi:hypothetical protein